VTRNERNMGRFVAWQAKQRALYQPLCPMIVALSGWAKRHREENVSDSVRASGWYWVQEQSDHDWLVYEWCAGVWWPANGSPTVTDTALHAIDERRILLPGASPS
jgi:hypothetical protein